MYCYKFPSRSNFLDLAAAEGMTTVDDNGDRQLIAYTHTYSIDEIGPIIEGGEWDADGNEVVPPVVISGHHVNFQGEPPETWDEHLIVVNSASRIWAGGSTQAPSTDILEELIA